MGCWGITAFESDAGLDSVEFIRKNIPGDGRLELGKIIEAMQKENYLVYDVTDGLSHSGPMALVEVIIKMNGWDFSDLDYDGGRIGRKRNSETSHLSLHPENPSSGSGIIYPIHLNTRRKMRSSERNTEKNGAVGSKKAIGTVGRIIW